MTAETRAAFPDLELSDGLKDERRKVQRFTGFPDAENSRVIG